MNDNLRINHWNGVKRRKQRHSDLQWPKRNMYKDHENMEEEEFGMTTGVFRKYFIEI